LPNGVAGESAALWFCQCFQQKLHLTTGCLDDCSIPAMLYL